MSDADDYAPKYVSFPSTESAGSLIRRLRKTQGITQSELAAKVGVSAKWLSQLENGKPTVEFGLVNKTLNELGYFMAIERINEPDPSVYERFGYPALARPRSNA